MPSRQNKDDLKARASLLVRPLDAIFFNISCGMFMLTDIIVSFNFKTIAMAFLNSQFKIYPLLPMILPVAKKIQNAV